MSDQATVQGQLEQTLEAMLAGRFEEAYLASLSIVEAAPGEPRAWEMVAASALAGGRPELAYEAFTQRRALAEDEETVLGQVAAAYHALDVETALAHAREATKLWPQSAQAAAWVATLEAIDTEAALLVSVGRTLYREGRYEEALDVLVGATEAGGGSDAYLWLGRAFLATGDARSAVALLEPLMGERGDDASLAIDIATGYARLDRADIARAYLDAAREAFPDDAEVPEAIARLAMDGGDYGSAVEAARAATLLAPTRASAWLALAGGLEATNRLDLARLAVDRSIALDDDEPAAWALGARIIERSGETGLAARYRAAVAIVGGVGAAPASFPPMGDVNQESHALYAFVQADPTQAIAYRDRATIYRLLGEHERALYYLDLVERDLLTAPNPGTMTERGAVLMALGRPDEARIAFDAAISVAPGFTPATAGLAELDRLAVAAPAVDAPSPAASGATFCSQCGTRFEDDAVFCGSCGARRSS